MDFNKYKNQKPYPTNIKDVDERKQKRKEYNDEERRLINLFKIDALEYVGLSGHPKANNAFELAWSRGHSSGLSSVLNELEELVDLLV